MKVWRRIILPRKPRAAGENTSAAIRRVVRAAECIRSRRRARSGRSACAANPAWPARCGPCCWRRSSTRQSADRPGVRHPAPQTARR
ncbi:hypothetical protein G6F57_022357 [Rhizopus arrhizus]|nr:hypothetical protein G6F57_022357 [Rhizopus arrhizus]